MILNKDCYERGCAAYDDRVDEGVVIKKVWKNLTTAEVKVLWNATKKPIEFAAMIQAKLKEKNYE